MMPRIYQHKKFSWQAFVPAIIWGVTILILSIIAGLNLPKVPLKIISADKLAHAAAYFVLAMTLMYGFRRNQMRFATAAWVSATGSALYGVGMEILQYSFFPYRYFEMWDIVANIIGCLVGILVSYFFIK